MRLKVLLVGLLARQLQTAAFRILSSLNDPLNGTHAVFAPYEHGRVGYYGDPTVLEPERVNEGGPFSPDTPRVFLSQPVERTSRSTVWPVG